MKHRHRIKQRQHRETARSKINQSAEQPLIGASKAKRSAQFIAEGRRPKYRLDKSPRGGRRFKRYGAGGAADAPGADPGQGADSNAPLSLNPADYSNVGMNAEGQWINSNTGKLLDQPPLLSPSGIAYMLQAANNPQVKDLVKRVNAESELKRVLEYGADATSIPGGLAKQSGGRIKEQRKRS
jgi:hypothetical protein